jgi:hypothetical protein
MVRTPAFIVDGATEASRRVRYPGQQRANVILGVMSPGYTGLIGHHENMPTGKRRSRNGVQRTWSPVEAFLCADIAMIEIQNPVAVQK